jgi:hypothetical protein
MVVFNSCSISKNWATQARTTTIDLSMLLATSTLASQFHEQNLYPMVIIGLPSLAYLSGNPNTKLNYTY